MDEPNRVEEPDTEEDRGHTRAFFYSIDELPTQSIAEMAAGLDDKQAEGSWICSGGICSRRSSSSRHGCLCTTRWSDRVSR